MRSGICCGCWEVEGRGEAHSDTGVVGDGGARLEPLQILKFSVSSWKQEPGLKLET